MSWRDTLSLFCKSCVQGTAGRGKITWQPGEQSRSLEKVEIKEKKWNKPAEGLRSKHLKSDLEIMLTQHSSCVCSRGTALGSHAALGGATDGLRRLGIPCPWSKPRQCSGAWRGGDRDHLCLPDLFMPSPCRMFQANELEHCTCGCSSTLYFRGCLK